MGASAHRNKLLKKKIEKLSDFLDRSQDLEQSYLVLGREEAIRQMKAKMFEFNQLLTTDLVKHLDNTPHIMRN